jgi:hypothetical protein
MRVLFLALGGSRRLAVTEESRAVAESGGSAVVLVSRRAPWADEAFAPGVDVRSLTDFPRHWPLTAESVVLFKGPRFLLRRLAGFGTERAGRAVAAYDRRFANRVHRRAFRPVYGRLWPDGVHKQLDVFIRQCGAVDAIVVTDALSFTAGQRIVERMAAATGAPPAVAFRINQILAPVASGEEAS